MKWVQSQIVQCSKGMWVGSARAGFLQCYPAHTKMSVMVLKQQKNVRVVVGCSCEMFGKVKRENQPKKMGGSRLGWGQGAGGVTGMGDEWRNAREQSRNNSGAEPIGSSNWEISYYLTQARNQIPVRSY